MSGKNFPDVPVRKADRQLVVRTVWSPARKGWSISVEDSSVDGRLKDHTVGAFALGQTSLWCETEHEVQQAQLVAFKSATLGPIRRSGQ
jgi:hypothetical protein